MKVTSIQDLQKYIIKELQDTNAIYAVRIPTRFKHIVGRSFPPTPPGIPSDKWINKMQKIHHLDDIHGTVFGFITPDYLSPLLVIGPHFHFITDDHKRVFHLYDFEFDKATVQIMKVKKLALNTDLLE